jgi:hypothetical protein
MATVFEEPGGYTASVHKVFERTNARWVPRHIADLSTAQQIADDQIPRHECACGGWMPFVDPLNAPEPPPQR